MKERIAEGRLEPTGSMWVEADCNIPVGRVPGPPDRLRQAVLPRRARDRDRRRVAARRVRLLGRPAPDHAPERYPVVPHPEALVEPVQRPPPPQLPLGGNRRLPGLHPLPAGRHLQRQRQRPRAPLRRGELQGPRACHPLALPVRLGRRRRRPDRRDARIGPAAGRHRRAAPPDHGGATALLHRGRGRDPRPGRLGGRALSRAAPGHLHHPGRHQARRTAGPSSPCGTPSCGPRWPPARRLPAAAGSRSSGSSCSSTSSTTSSPDRGSTGSTTTRPRPRPHSG